MRLSTATAFALIVLLVAVTVGPVAATTSARPMAAEDGSTVRSSQSHPSSSSLDRLSPTGTASQAGDGYDPEPADPGQIIRLNVTDDGAVQWTVESRFRFHENETEAFTAFADAVVDGERVLSGGYGSDQYDRALTEAERSTGRNMMLEDGEWNETIKSTRVDDDVRIGSISYSFTWTNFTVVDADRIYFGDAFTTDDGVWFPILDDGQRLIVESPSNYGVDTAPAGARVQSGEVIHDGYTELTSNDLEIVFLRSSGAEPSTPPEPNEPSPSSEPTEESFLSTYSVGIGVAVVTILAVFVFLAVSRYKRSEWPFDGTTETAKGALWNPRSSQNEVNEPQPSETNSDGGIEHEFDETDTGTGIGMETPDDEIDPDLLSDEERVLRLLNLNNGRMKQATIVSETGWSNAKVSQLLSKMDDDDEIEKLRIGRENLITLPGVDPTETS